MSPSDRAALPPGAALGRSIAMLKSALTILLALALSACGSAGSGGDGPETTTGDALRVTWRDYRSGLVLELVSRSHTDQKELYSAARGGASTKVQEDLYMLALVNDFLSGEGYYDVARRGPAPSEAGGSIRHALEVDRNGELTHLTVGTSTSTEVAEIYNDCRRGFIELYNATNALQTVDNTEGNAYFDNRKPQVQR